MKPLIIPALETETEEIQWWDGHLEQVEENLAEAIHSGTARRGTTARILSDARKARAGAFRHVSIRILEEDLVMAREQARERGLAYQNYIASVLHEAIARRRR